MIRSQILNITKIKSRSFHSSFIVGIKNVPIFDDAEIMADKLNFSNYTAKRNKLDYQWDLHSDSQSENEQKDRLQKMMKLSAIFQGLLFLLTVGTAGTIYLKWPQVKNWWITKDIRIDDDSIEKLKQISEKNSTPNIPLVQSDEPASDIPGLYYWGETLGDGKMKKFPRRVHWFDGKYLRDVALSNETANLAIDNKGNLVSWTTNTYNMLLPDQNLTHVKISQDVAYALNSKGEILVIPLKDEQLRNMHTSIHRSLLCPWKKYYKYDWKLEVKDVFKDKRETKIIQFDVGKQHLVFLSNKRKAYTCATGIDLSTKSISKGQFGIPTLSQFDPFPQCNKVFEIELLNKAIVGNDIIQRCIEKVSCGNYHTLACDSMGDLYAFGLNRYGQLGLPISYDMEYVPFPRKVTNFAAYFSRNDILRCVDVQCAGDTSYVSIIPHKFHTYTQNKEESIHQSIEDVTYFSFGNGLYGQLGNGNFKHSQSEPIKLKEVNVICDHIRKDETSRRKIQNWYCGPMHSFCKLENGDILAWGYNEYGQLGNGKRIKWCKPKNIIKILEPGVNYNKTIEELLISPDNTLKLNHMQQMTTAEKSSCIYWRSN